MAMILGRASFSGLSSWRSMWLRMHGFSSGGKVWSVSSLGRCRTSYGKITLGSLRLSGYREVKIFGESFLVHRVVAHAFLGLPPDEETWQVHHRDGNPSNNCLDNLEYLTHSQNIKRSYDTNAGRRTSRASCKQVMWRPDTSHAWATFPSIRMASQQLGISCYKVAQCCNTLTRVGQNQFMFAEPLEPPLLPGEKWLPMINPATGLEVFGRQVSSFGRLKSCSGSISRGSLHPTGYFLAALRVDATWSSVLVHRLVAFAFVGPPPSPEHIQVNHKDGNKRNNCVDNLEYVTPQENMRHSYSFKDTRRRCRKSLSKVVLARRFGTQDEWTFYPSMSAAGKILGVWPGSVSACTRGKVKRVGNYEFRLDIPMNVAEQLPGEEWRVVDLKGLQEEKQRRLLARC